MIELPGRLKRGDRVRVLAGPLTGAAGLYAGQEVHERVAILLVLMGAARRVTLPAARIEAAVRFR